jgi:hypothetical protein
MEVSDWEAKILAVEASYRVRLPQPLCTRVGWIAGEQPIEAWLLVANAGRCRLLSEAEFNENADLRLLRARIVSETTALSTRSLEFRDEVSVALAQRLLAIQITPHETSGWRFTLPRVLAAIMRVSPKQSDLAALFVQEHIEIWTIDALTSAVSGTLTEIV